MSTEPPLARIDSFAYRHRLSEVMATPVLTGSEGLTVGEACSRMQVAKVSSLVVVGADGRGLGIITERDVCRALAEQRAGAHAVPVAAVMGQPLRTVPADAFLFVALGRMARLGVRHLTVVDAAERPVGILTARALMKVRVSEALMIGDAVAEAQDAADLRRAREALPALAGNLLAEGISARAVASVISSVLRDMTDRAAELAELAMLADGWGPAPAAWTLLVLGSVGRGESLLAFDQDNALVHGGTAADDPWFAELGRRTCETLHQAGLPFCNGAVMANNPAWRHSLDDWRKEIQNWVFRPAEQTIMNTDIFFDFQPARGDRGLAEALRRIALETAGESAFFLQYLGMNVAKMDMPLGFFGEFITIQGRLNAKKGGLLPLVSAARARAVRAHVEATATGDRYRALAEAGRMHPSDATDLVEVHELLLRTMLDQQLADIAAGLAPSARIEPRRLPRDRQRRLKAAFRRIRTLKVMMSGPMAG